MNIIKYNSIEIPLPTPYVEIKKENIFENKKYGEIFNIKLDGQLLSEFTYSDGGLYPPYEALMYRQKYLLNIFSKNWGKFEVLEEKSYLDGVIVTSPCTDLRPYIRTNDYIYNKFNLTTQLEEFIIFNGTNWIISSKSLGGGYSYNFNGFPIFNGGPTIGISPNILNTEIKPWNTASWSNGSAGFCTPITTAYAKSNLSVFPSNEFIRSSSDIGSLGYRKITWANGSLKPNTKYIFYYRNTSDVYTSTADYSNSSPDLSMFDLSNGTCGATLAKYAPAGNFEYNLFRGIYRSDNNGGCTIWLASPSLILFPICFDNLFNYAKANLTAAGISNSKLFYLRELKQYDTIFSKDQIVVKSISFPKESYRGLISYSIELENSYYTNNVKNINNQYNFSEDKNGIVQVNHQVSAQGLRTNSISSSSNALQNAINFVKNYTGINLIPSGYFTKEKSYILVESKEYIDHTNASYSIEETFSSANFNKSGVLNYTVDVVSGKGMEALKIDLKGSLSCGKTYKIEDAQNNLKPIDLIKNYYSGYINPVPIDYSITKDLNKNEINFNYTFDNLNVPNPYVRYSINKNRDKINEITNISINVNFQTRGNYKVILLNGTSFLSNANDLTPIQMPVAPYSLANTVYSQNPEYNQNNRTLTLLNTSKINSPYQNNYEYQLNYTDKMIPSGFKDASYSFQYDMPLKIYKPNQCVEGSNLYVFQNFNIKNLGKLKVSADLSINRSETWNPNNKPINIDPNLFIITSETTSYNKDMGTIKYNIDGIRNITGQSSNTLCGVSIN